MPLDPQVREFLDELAALDPPPLTDLTPEEARANTLAETVLMGPAEPVAKKEDRQIPGPHGPIPIRIYTPEGEGPFGVFVYYHGGGWVVGDIPSHEGVCCALANGAGCVVVSVDYRLAPEYKYPAAADDCYAATKWVAENAESFGGDSSRIAVGGDSAGGNLAAVVTLMARDRGGPAICFQVLVYPVTDFNFNRPSYVENAEGYFLTREGMQWFWNHYLGDERDGAEPYASPLREKDLSSLPPALVLTAEYDPLRDEGEEYAARLRTAGVPTRLTRYDGMIHAFFRRTDQFARAEEAQAEVAEALRKAFE